MRNVIAIIWDYDKTLLDGYMQSPIFKEYKIDEKAFWTECNDMQNKHPEVKINKDTAYLIKFTRDARNGLFKGLDNKKLKEYGKQQIFYKGLPEFLKTTKELFINDKDCQEYDVRVEHYIVSTGFAEIIKGTPLKDYVEDIWGCELLEGEDKDGNIVISDVCYAIDNTSKTRAIFEINKGVNKKNGLDVNAKMNDDQRRVDFRNMIYIADGPSDVPAFSLIKKNKGITFAVYPKGNEKAFAQVDQLRQEGRIDMFGEADYSKGSLTYNWIIKQIIEIKNRIIRSELNNQATISAPPGHIVE